MNAPVEAIQKTIQREKLPAPLAIANLLQIAAWQHDLAWEPFREGIDSHRLYGDSFAGAAAALLRYQPGARERRTAITATSIFSC